jgi:hypothetical protein
LEPDYRGITPKITFILPVTEDTIQINPDAKNGINFPGYILSSNTTLYLPDTIFSPSEFPVLWNQNSNNPPIPSDGETHYLANGGAIFPNMIKDTISVSYNPIVFNFYTGFKAAYTGDSISTQLFLNDSLIYSDSTNKILYTHINLPITEMMGMIYEHQPADTLTLFGLRHNRAEREELTTNTNDLPEFNINLYPNPTTDIFHLSYSGVQTLDGSLIDMMGNQINQYHIITGVNSFDVTALCTGTYIFTIAQKNSLVYTKKIIIAR